MDSTRTNEQEVKNLHRRTARGRCARGRLAGAYSCCSGEGSVALRPCGVPPRARDGEVGQRQRCGGTLRGWRPG
uniref:Uncharacterized protein n=2 Tax=Oryza sativa subsp. japonica TaxID=39947 RepID=Q69J86_ORYSJ|nr:hypothetical protein [Oryza sativa Japonica Group]BAD31976.1 hypothetical protein [Oryza sativa Japonica Group]